MNQLQTILDSYYKLCGYCDQIWNRIRLAYHEEIACRKGCGICCELESVSQIEAHIIRLHLEKSGACFLKKIECESNQKCPFLREDACLIYEARPLICRTHGLVLRSTEFRHLRAASCPYNFPSLRPDELSEEFTLDIDMATKNLIKLNLAFCICKNIQNGAQNRVPLVDLYNYVL